MDVSRKSVPAVSHHPSTVTSTGFTLIEVLVSLSVTTIGLLGLAALQLHGLRGAHEATLRTQAVALATDIAERLHANAPHCADVGCTSPSLSEAEIHEWDTRLAHVLPQGEGRIVSTSSEANVTVQWDAHDTAQRFTLSLTP